ncbi:MAG: ECF transporter S component [Thermoproteales archaeon]|nr:ECF transporter S component [Thermoproteales archaeon]
MRRRISFEIATTVIGAILYALGSYVTSYIVSPWGTGQFRPAIIIPSIFAIFFGPNVGGLSAAIGTFIADSLKHGTLYLKSFIAAVPSNFIGFYLLGKLLERDFTWRKFIIASIISLAVGNLICALLVAVYYLIFVPAFASSPLLFLVSFVIGLTSWWFATMIPFQIILVPPLLRILTEVFPTITPPALKHADLTKEVPGKDFVLTLTITGLIILVIALAVSFSKDVAFIFTGGLNPGYRETVKSLIVAMFSITGVTLLAVGIAFPLLKKRA